MFPLANCSSLREARCIKSNHTFRLSALLSLPVGRSMYVILGNVEVQVLTPQRPILIPCANLCSLHPLSQPATQPSATHVFRSAPINSMTPSISTFIFLGLSLTSLCTAQLVDGALVGTWSTKSKAVFTGPGFYNPVTDRLIEPNHPGISYSFTEDGHYEEAYYRAISNREFPTNSE